MALWELASLRGVDGWLVFVFLGGVVFLIARRQNDALETTETAVRMLVGMLLAVLLLVYYAILGWTLLGAGSEEVSGRMGEVVLAAVFFLPLLITGGVFMGYPFYWRRKWRLGQLDGSEPDVRAIFRLADWLGVARSRFTVWRAGVMGLRTPLVFRPVWGRAMVVLPMWDWRVQFADDPAGKETVGEFVLLHELGHIKNQDATFVTWAGMFLAGFRWWVGVVGLVQLVGLLILPTGWLRMSLWLGFSATAVSFVVFNLLFLSVLRQRELLADARAQLYLAEGHMKRLLSKTRLFRVNEKWRAGHPAGRRISWWPSLAPTALFPILPWSSIATPASFLMTHPPISERRRFLEERKLIQNTQGTVSASAVLWISLVASLLVFFFYGAFLYVEPSQDPTYLSSTIGSVLFLAMIYPGIAFALPLRNSATHLQVFSRQFKQMLLHIGRLWVVYLVVAGVGYGNLCLGFALRGWVGFSPWDDYLTIAGIQFFFAPLLASSLFFFARVLFVIFNRESRVTIIWFWSLIVLILLLITVAVNGVLALAGSLFLNQINLFMATIMVACVGGVLLNLGVSASFDASSLVMELGVLGRLYWWEWRYPAGYIAWGTLVILAFFSLLFTLALGVAIVILPLFDRSYWLVTFLVSMFAILLVGMFAIARRSATERPDFKQDMSQLLGVGLLLELAWAVAYERPTPPAGLERLDQVYWSHYPAGTRPLSDEYHDFVEGCAVDGGGFALRPGGYARLTATYHALVLLAPNIPNPEQQANWLMARFMPSGGFGLSTSGQPSAEATWLAVQSLAVLGALGRLDRARCIEWLWGRWLASGRGLAMTHYVVVSLGLLGGLIPGRVALLQQNWLPRYHSLSAGWRVDKQIEPIWHYCHIITTLFAHDADAISQYTQHLVLNIKGGIENTPYRAS